MSDAEEDQEASTLARPRRRSWPRYLLIVAVIAAIAGFYLAGLGEYLSWESVHANVDAWQGRVEQNLLPAVLVFFVIYTAITALSLPAAAAMTLLGGALFGRVLGTVLVSAASTLGATLAFLGSRYLLRDWVQTRYGGRLRAINEGIERDGAYYLFMLRLVPLVPFFLINLGMGLTPIGVGTYVVTSWAGMLLGTFLYVNAGTAIATIESPGDVLSLWVLISFAALGVVPLLIRKLVRWRPTSPSP